MKSGKKKKRNSALGLVSAAIIGAAAVQYWWGGSKPLPAPTASAPHAEMEMTAVRPQGVGEFAPYRIEDRTVYVNNRLCAVSHSPLDPENPSRFTSHVKYSGSVEEFRNKTLVFNQCCEMCIQKFPDLWRAQQDAILRFHGLALNR